MLVKPENVLFELNSERILDPGLTKEETSNKPRI